MRQTAGCTFPHEPDPPRAARNAKAHSQGLRRTRRSTKHLTPREREPPRQKHSKHSRSGQASGIGSTKIKRIYCSLPQLEDGTFLGSRQRAPSGHALGGAHRPPHPVPACDAHNERQHHAKQAAKKKKKQSEKKKKKVDQTEQPRGSMYLTTNRARERRRRRPAGRKYLAGEKRDHRQTRAKNRQPRTLS